MAFTYRVDELATSALFRVRRELGDVRSPGLLVDEEIEFYLDSQATEDLAVAAAADAIAAQVAQDPKRFKDAIGSETEWDPNKLIAQMREIARRKRGLGGMTKTGSVSGAVTGRVQEPW